MSHLRSLPFATSSTSDSGDRDDSQTQGLNRQVNSTNKDLYSVSSQQNINLTVNHQKDLLAEQSKKQKSKLKQKLETGKISQQEYDQQLEYIHNQQLAVNGLLAALGAPTDSVAGQVAAGLSPMAANKIGDYFQEVANDNPDGQLTSTQQTEHVLAHAVLAAAVAATGGNDATTAAIAAGGSEATAPVLSQALYGTQDPSKLTDEQKNTLTTIADLAGTVVGATTGEGTNAVASGQAAQNAVVNNYYGHMDASGKIDTPIVTALKEQETAFKDEHCVGLSQKDCAGAYANHQREQLQDIPVVGSVAAVGQCMNGNDAACKDIVVNVTTDVVTGVTGTVLIKVGGEVVKYSIGKLGDVVSDTYTLIQNKRGKGRAPGALKNTETNATKKAETVVSSSSKDAVGNTGTTQAESVVTNGAVKFKRWKNGDAIDKPMADDSAPSWDVVRSRYWKNRASSSNGEFSKDNLARMRQGNAPLDFNSRTGKFESRELHHVVPQRAGGSNGPLNLRELTPDQHGAVDPFRHTVPTTSGIR